MVKTVGLRVILSVLLVLACPGFLETVALNAQSRSAGVANGIPEYVWDSTWPKQPPLPNDWVVGPVVGVSVDANDHIWVVHRPRGRLGSQRDCCPPAPAVLEFDQAGKLVQAWGGPSAEQLAAGGQRGRGLTIANLATDPRTMTWSAPTNYEWPASEHNIFVDYKDNIWLGNYGGSHILKFTRQGKFLLQIGRPGAKGGGSNDPGAFGSPTGIVVNRKTNEVYVADGYGNRRIIVFDADTGAYKRHWGAYGKKPDDTVPVELKARAPLQQLDIVHCVQIDRDDLVWVCDRGNSRIQVFRKDGTFIKEGWVGAPEAGTVQVAREYDDGKGGTRKIPTGSVFDLAFSRDAEQRYVFVADGSNERVWIVLRSDLKTIGSIGHPGHWGGGFTLPHNVAVDSKNNLYVSESGSGSRVQRFLYKGSRPR